MSQNQLIFGCAVSSAAVEAQACLLAESIRCHAGRFAGNPIWVFVPVQAHHLAKETETRFKNLGVRALEFEIDPAAQGFPFAGKVMASAIAEEMAAQHSGLLVWLDPDSIVFQEPEAFNLQPEKGLGCRPVDHVLIGSPADQAIDDFWRDVYRVCSVPRERVFTMTTSTDQIRIRLYINAGFLVVHANAGLLRRWRILFVEALEAKVFDRYYENDILYRIFLHQAILAGVVLSRLTEAQIQVLPYLVNYPMHMHDQYPLECRPARMNDLISGRYDTLFQNPDWPERFPIDEPLRSWLRQQLAKYDVVGGR